MRPDRSSATAAGWSSWVLSARRSESVVAATGDRLLDLCILGIASWTLIYQLCLMVRLGVAVALLGQGVVVVAAVVWLVWRRFGDGTPAARATESVAATRPNTWRWFAPLLVVGAGGVAAWFGAWVGPWWLTSFGWLLVAAAALLYAQAGSSIDSQPAVPDRTSVGAWFVLVVAVGMAVLSLLMVQPDSDDGNYVHLSSWIGVHGSFPLRDTLFSDQVYPSLYWPPVDSYPALAGAMAWLFGVSAPSIVYFVVPPVFSFLAVLALWRLLRAWRTASAWLALAVAVAFLMWDTQRDRGGTYYGGGFDKSSAGNFFIVRMWQGKVLFICLVIPLLYVYLQQHLRDPKRQTLLLLAAAGIAGVGLSTSAMFVLPLLAVAAVAPLALRQPRRALTGCAAAGGYPAFCALLTGVLGGRTPDEFVVDQVQPEYLSRFVLGAGVLAAVGLAGILLAGLTIRDRLAAVMLSAAGLVVALVYLPGVGDGIFYVTGLSRTQWRLFWIVPTAALVGALAAWCWSRIGRPTGRVVVAAAIVVGLALAGPPIWSAENFVHVGKPTYKLPRTMAADAKQVAGMTAARDVVLLAEPFTYPVAVLNPDVRFVGMRRFMVEALADEPGFHAAARLRLQDFAAYRDPPAQWSTVPADLQTVGVTLACLPNARWSRHDDRVQQAQLLLRSRGYRQVSSGDLLDCYRPPAAID